MSEADYPTLQPVRAEHYVISGTVARGGMGRILRARDRRLGRDVAIKELLSTSADHAARFEREIRITSSLQHPGIVSIQEAGVWPSGEPFYAMKLVGGRALDDVMRGAKTLPARLALLRHVIDVAEALAFAHSRDVIHRDLKPANVLVGEFGETVVIDWGLAKDLRSSELEPTLPSRGNLPPARAASDSGANETQIGTVLGTPAYMPPEQARGDRVDARADVYSIGALLYAVIAGHAPYDGNSADAILDKVIDERPAELATVVPEAPADLVAIVGKAMSRRPENRYADAQELAKDLRRFQTGQLVGARSYTTAQRFLRFVRRNRVSVSFVVVAFAILATTAIVSVLRVVDERNAAEVARAEAEAQRATAETQQTRAAQQRDGAEQLIEFMLGDLEPQLDRVGRLDLMRGVATQIDGYYGRLATPASLDRRTIDRRAIALRLLGDVLSDSGDPADASAANRAYLAAIALEESAPSPTSESVTARARAELELGASLLAQGDLDGAGRELDRARGELQALTPRPVDAEVALASTFRRLGMLELRRGHADTAIAELGHCADSARVAMAGAHDASAKKELASCLDWTGDAEAARGAAPAAEAAAHQALELRAQMQKDDPGDLEVRFGMAASWERLAALAAAGSDAAAATRATDSEIAIAESLVERDADHASWSRMLETAYMRRADAAATDAAAQTAAQAIALAEHLVQRAPRDAERIADLAELLARRGKFLVDAHQLDPALEALRRALELAEQARALAPADARAQAVVAKTRAALDALQAPPKREH